MPARAYDPATTHAGLTEQAVLASELHRVLAHRLSRPLGLFEPIVLNRADLDPTVARLLGGRLDALDPSGGYRPGADGAAPALAWVVAGTVIAETPAERAQNLFFDPSRGSGLSQGGGAFQVGHDLRMLFAEGGGLRGAATGTTFNLTGRPSPEWLVAPDNDVGLKAFYDGLEQATVAERPGPRGTALARALLALGGTLAVLEDAGDPAHVRNDFRGAYLADGGSSLFDRGSPFERYVAETFGQAGVPRRGHAGRSPDGAGLHHRRRSAGAGRSHAAPVLLGRHAARARRRRSTDDPRRGDARRARVAPLRAPAVPHLDLVGMGDVHYAYAPTEQGAPRRPSGDCSPTCASPDGSGSSSTAPSITTARGRCSPRSAPTPRASSITCSAPTSTSRSRTAASPSR